MSGGLTRGARDSLALGLALVPIGLAFGYVAEVAGLTWWMAGLMSLITYAGPSQFLAVGLLGVGAGIPAIVATVLVANLRYTLFAASLAPHLRDAPRRRLPLLAHGLADGSYAVTLQEATDHPERPRLDRYLMGSMIVSFGFWVPSSVAGSLIGDALPEAVAFGLGFATPAIFIAFLVAGMRDAIGVAVMLVAGLGSVAGQDVLPTGTAPIVAIVVASTLGGTLTWQRRPR